MRPVRAGTRPAEPRPQQGRLGAGDPANEQAAHRWRWPFVATAVSIGAAMAWSLLVPWHETLAHGSLTAWRVPGDIWATLRSAHVIAWGDLGGVYGAGTGLIAFPGAALLLVPVALVDSALGLTESFPFTLPHPTAWFVLGPYEVALSCLVLFALDALAARLRVPARRRVLLVWLEAAVLFPVSAIWGHPEDAVAVALLLWALERAADDRWTAAGWLVGAAVAVQPLVLLGLPVLVGAGGRRQLATLLVRAALPAVAVVAVPLAAAPHATWHALVAQPNFPNIDHPTPWTALAPRLGGHGRSLAVAAGPGRLVALALALAGAPMAWRWRDRLDRLSALLAGALALRVLTESVLVPYYLWPPLAVALVAAAAARSWRLLVVAATGALAGSVLAEVSVPWLLWWTAAVAAVTGAVAVAGWAVVPRAAQSQGERAPGRNSSSAAILPLAPVGHGRCSEAGASQLSPAAAGLPRRSGRAAAAAAAAAAARCGRGERG